jgi:hypothetical protein
MTTAYAMIYLKGAFDTAWAPAILPSFIANVHYTL